jgi:hypothetical protein
MLVGTNPELDPMYTENDSKMKKEVEAMKLQRMTKVDDFLEIWQGSQNLRARQKGPHTSNLHTTAVGYILDPEKIFKAS